MSNLKLVAALLCSLWLTLLAAPVSAQAVAPVFSLAPPPRLPLGVAPYIPPGSPATTLRAANAVSVNPFNRAAVAALYRDVYVAQSNAVVDSVNVNLASCDPGTTPLALRQTVIERVNVFRALAGLPGTVTLFGNPQRAEGQAAALIMVANASLSHNPPNTWACWSQAGANGAGHSNITLGRSSGPGFAYNGVAAIRGYMDDSGVGNERVGHRRWLLFPPQAHMATGDTYTDSGPGSYAYASSNALWVLGSFGPRPSTPDGTAWPPRGHVPWQLLPATSNRWSFSYPGADFSAAAVSMDREGVPVPVTIVAADNDGFGDATIVWEPVPLLIDYSIAPDHDISYHVTVSGMGAAGAAGYSYTVTVIDPYTVSDLIFADGFD